jgi:hypothetical protein
LVAVKNGEESAPVDAIVVVPVCPAAKVFAESVPAKNAVEEAEVKERADGSERVMLPSPSSATVIWFAVPAIQLVSEETADTIPEPSSASRREGVRDWNVVAPETLRAVVEAVPKYPVPETVSAVELAYGKVLALVAVEVIAPTVEIAPLSRTVKSGLLLEFVVWKLTPVVVPAPFTESFAYGEVEPIPTFPPGAIVMRSVPAVTKRSVSSFVLLVSAVMYVF